MSGCRISKRDRPDVAAHSWRGFVTHSAAGALVASDTCYCMSYEEEDTCTHTHTLTHKLIHTHAHTHTHTNTHTHKHTHTLAHACKVSRQMGGQSLVSPRVSAVRRMRICACVCLHVVLCWRVYACMHCMCVFVYARARVFV